MILTYEDFLIKEGYMTVEESKAKLLLTVAERCSTPEERDSLQYFINEGFTNDLFDIATSIDESFAEKFKEMAAKAAERAKELGKAAKDKLGDSAKMALKFGGNIMAALKVVLGKIKEALAKMWEFVKTKAQSAYNAEKENIEKNLIGKLKDPTKRQDLIDEVGNLGKMGAAVTKFVTGGAVEDMAKSAASAAESNESNSSYDTMITFDQLFEAAFYNAAAQTLADGYSIEEAEKELLEFNALFEGGHGDGTSAQGLHIPFISTIMKLLGKIPPFNMLHKVEAQIAKSTEKGLNAFSIFATKVADAPGPFTFPVMAGIMSIAAGYMIEQKVKQGVLDVNDVLIKALGFGVPGIGALYTFMKWGGMILAIYGGVKNLLGKWKEEHGEDGHDEEKH